MKITIEDVAEKAGVSITTVSRVLNNNYPVKKETRKKVEAAIKELDFTPNLLARGLIQKKTYTIGVLVPSITNPFFPVVVNGIQDFLSARDYQLFLCDTGGQPEKEEKSLKGFMERQVDGIISIDPRTSNIKSGVYCEASAAVPTVLVNGYSQGMKLNYVLSDQEEGSWDALRYLYSLGHRDIIFLRGPKSHSYEMKEEVYRKFLHENKLEWKAENIIEVRDGNSISAVDLTIKALEKRLSIKGNRPSAIFACNDWMGVGAIYAAQKIGLDVPGELSVTGYDNTVISCMSMPKLTTVDQNMQLLGETAADLLFQVMSGEGKSSRKIVLETQLVRRESCGPQRLGYMNRQEAEKWK